MGGGVIAMGDGRVALRAAAYKANKTELEKENWQNSLRKQHLITDISFCGHFITPPSGRGLVIPIFFPWCVFFGGHLPQTSGFRSAKQILVVFFATQARAFIFGDRNIFYTPGGGGENNGGV